MSSEAAKTTTAVPQARTEGLRSAERPKLALVRKVEVDRSRDALLTDFGKTTLEDRYLLPGESYQDMLSGVEHANFFEARSTEYSKAATRGQWHGNEGVWSEFDRMQLKRAEAVGPAE